MSTATDVVTKVEKVAETIHEAIPPAIVIAEIVKNLYPAYGLIIMGLKIADTIDLAVIAACNRFMETNGGDASMAQAQLLAHLNPNMPNSPLLNGNKKPSEPIPAT